MNLKKDTTISHYKILSQIGKGGMGEVYLAQDTKLNRQVAIKFLSDEFSKDSDKLNRFVQEAQSASALNHPNIITVFEIGETDNTQYIALEYIEGETLKARLKKKIKFNTALDVATQIASALDAAHSAGIVHRDIKPDNVMIRKDGFVKILDFGIAKLTEQKKPDIESEDKTAVQVNTTPGMIIGTANYMSPEQAKGKDVDARTDVFSFGVVLYEMITGRLPFEGESPLEIIGSILKDEPKPIDNSAVPVEVERIISKTLRKDRDERYQTIRDVLIDLKDAKQDLEFQDKLDKTIQPSRDHEQDTQMFKATTAAEAQQTTASGINDSITFMKSGLGKAVAGILAILLVSAIGFGYWYFSSGSQINSIAVMPFVNESGSEDVEYLSDGMTETLIGSLSKLPNLNVKPSSSVFRYKGMKTDAKTIGQELNVHAILNGRIVQRGDELTLSLELVDVRKDAVLWSERYVRKQSDLISLQSEIAKDVSSRLKTRLTGAEEEKIAKSYTADAEAYRDYLQGRYYWNKRDGVNLRKAIEQFKAAVDKDPNYALAYVGLADSYAVFPWWDDDFPVDSLSRARQFAKRAIEIDDSLGEAHASLAYVNLYSWNWAEAEKEFLRAIELSPDYANAHRWYHEYLITQGRVDEATLTLKKAYELEPLSVIVNYNLATHYCEDKLDPVSAIDFAKRVVDLDPNFPGAPNLMACVYLQQGRNADALAEAKKAVELTNGKIRRMVSNLGVAYAKNGQTENAKAIIKELEEAYSKKNTVGVQIANVYAALGNKDKAFEWIEKDLENRGFELVLHIRRVAKFGSLKSDKRYAAILKRMGLPE